MPGSPKLQSEILSVLRLYWNWNIMHIMLYGFRIYWFEQIGLGFVVIFTFFVAVRTLSPF